MKKIILLVDDEVSILKLLSFLLGEQGYHVLTATSGHEGLELLKNNAVQVIITDQRMSKMNGSDFLKQVRISYPDTIRMLLSAYVDFDALKDAINEGGIYKFILKPWQDIMLLEYVREAFEISAKQKEMLRISSPAIFRDALTKLNNRFSFYESLLSLISTSKKNHTTFAVIYFNIDRFSHINRLLGQKNGDRVLQRLAQRLKNFIKKEQHIARMGNNEFTILVTEEKDLADLPSFLKTIFSIIKKPMVIEGKKLHLTASMGVSLYPKNGNGTELLIRHTMEALQYCKQLGGDQYHLYKKNMDDSRKTQLFLEADLHQALENDEFIIYYQPIYTPDKSQIVCVEALLRWQHPKHGLLLPGQFLHLCEEINLIAPIGEWVLHTACQQVKLWHDLGFPDFRLAVNISARQFNHPKLLDVVTHVLKSTQFPPNHLELEITETLIMQNIEKVIPILITLRALGIHLALDDFGTGYSSLSYLRKFPFTTLKIDRSFINDIDKTESGKAFVAAIIAMGQSLDLQLIAEGVETTEQLAFLQEKRCDFIQGYLYGRPLPKQDMLQLLMKL